MSIEDEINKNYKRVSPVLALSLPEKGTQFFEKHKPCCICGETKGEYYRQFEKLTEENRPVGKSIYCLSCAPKHMPRYEEL